MLFALGYNLLLGYTGLPSFGHGAYLRHRAPTRSGCSSSRSWPNLWFDLAGAARDRGAAGRAGRGLHLAPARHLLRAADHRVRPGLLVRRRSSGIRSPAARTDSSTSRRLPADFGFVAFDLKSNAAIFYFAFGVFAVVVVALWRLVHSPLGRVLTAIKQNETRAAFVGYNVWLYKWLAFTISAAVAGLAGGAVRARAAVGLPQRDEPALVRASSSMMVLIGGGLVSFWGPVHRRALLHPRARPPRRVHRDLAALVRPPVHGDGAVEARRHRRPVAGLAAAPTQGQAPAPTGGSSGLTMALFEARHLHKRFGRQVVLRGHLARVRGRAAVGHHGAERRRQDDLLQRADRPLRAGSRRRDLRRRRRSRAWRRAQIARARHLALVPDHEPVQRLLGARQRA